MTTTQPSRDYAEAAARAAALQSLDDETINPKCRTRLMTHGRRTPWAIVFLHGYTNCPQQWERFAEPWHARGLNVLIPRLPGHGMADRLGHALGKPGVDDICAAADEAIDIACGLGERVAVAGLSMSGALALRAARLRADVSVAMSIAPQIAPRNVPFVLVRPLMVLGGALPNQFVWWDQKLKAAIPGPQHAYPHFPSRPMCQFFIMGLDELAEARRPGARPRAACTVMVTSASDDALNNAPAHEIMAHWRANGANAETLDIGLAERVIHDMIDPDQPRQRIDYVYALLNGLIEKAMASAPV